MPSMNDELAPGLREELVTEALARRLEAVRHRVEQRGLEPAEAFALLRRHAAAIVAEALGAVPGPEQAELANQLAREHAARLTLVTPLSLLTGIRPEAAGLAVAALPDRPQIPLTANELLVNDRKQPSLGSQLVSEFQSAASVDLICAFVRFAGVSTMLDELRGIVERGGGLRVITTTYMGATERKALDALVEVGAEVRVAFDAMRTKLHAKAWILHRPRGLSTAFIGSSNLSLTAMHLGLEWNVRLAEAEAGSLIERMKATFATYWEDDAFEPYDPHADADRFDDAIERQQRRKSGDGPVEGFVGLDIRPWHYQRRMLEDLMVQRDRHDRHKNLVVAATGTGKTVVAALDYRALCERAQRRLSLLFVAHRQTILNQSRRTFAEVMRDPAFGEELAGGTRPREGRQVFAMVQTLRNDVDDVSPEAFDVVIVDEFHHAEAASYSRLLERLRPGELVGLTATPERMDGGDVTRWFDGRIAVELRVWEAIDRGYLAPFQYFGVNDTEDLSQLEWRRGGYDLGALSRVLTGNDVRARRVRDALHRYHPAPERMRALGFCVSVEHARFMAERFNSFGFASRAISGDTPEAERREVLTRLRLGELRCVFSVDVLGEGVDVPNVDTVLLLRPTQSATVFAQQLGRGLRLSDDKAALTVIDLVGQQHRNFRFEDKLRAVIDERQGSIREQAEEHFPYLPSGCSFVLDRRARDIVLENLKRAATRTQWGTLVEELRERGDVELLAWHESTGRRISDLYRARERGWTRLRRAAQLPTAPVVSGEDALLDAIRRLDHIDDPERVECYVDVLSAASPPRPHTERQRRMLAMLCDGLGLTRRPLDDALAALWRHRAVREEIEQLVFALGELSALREERLDVVPDAPLALHGRYTRREALLALGDGTVERPSTSREGVRWIEAANADALFVTLRKSERSFSPTTMYRDYAISRTLFHWESQNSTHAGTPTGRRYVGHGSTGSEVLLFVREIETRSNGSGAPFTCLGPVDYVSHEGGRPMQITWRLRQALPQALLDSSQLIAAA
jgi:superfamily II DNA or RNA helicase/HKD family nuclease